MRLDLPIALGFAATPVLAAAFPVLSLYSSNPQYPLAEVAPSVGLACAGALVFYALLLAYYRDAAKASVLVLPAVALAFSFDLFGRPDRKGEPSETLLLLDSSVEAAYGLLWILYGAVLIWMRRRTLPQTPARALRVVMAFVCAMPLVALGAWLVQSREVSTAAPPAPPAAVTDEDSPDIYYIVLDGYTRADVLAETFQLDNTAFLDALRARGFFVADRAHANYLQTHLSLASSLNLRYMDEVLAPDAGTVMQRCWRLVGDSAVSRLLKERGYSHMNVRSGYWLTSSNPAANLELGAPEHAMREFQLAVLQLTPLREWAVDDSSVGASLGPSVHRKRIRSQFETLPEVASRAERKFVFAHIVCPHPPFVFRRDGGPLDLGVPLSMRDASDFQGSPEQYGRGYSEQLLFVNDRLIETIDAIVAAYPPERRPVIIVQGDHGSGRFYDLRVPKRGALKERAAILSAVLLPADRRFAVSDSMTPVNTFRIIFNGLFGTDFAPLPDKTFFVSSQVPSQAAEIPASEL